MSYLGQGRGASRDALPADRDPSVQPSPEQHRPEHTLQELCLPSQSDFIQDPSLLLTLTLTLKHKQAVLTRLDSIIPVRAWNFTVFKRARSFFSTLTAPRKRKSFDSDFDPTLTPLPASPRSFFKNLTEIIGRADSSGLQSKVKQKFKNPHNLRHEQNFLCNLEIHCA